MRYFILFTMFLFWGCGGGYYYLFQTYDLKNTPLTKISKHIGLQEIEIPDYLKQDRLVFLENNHLTLTSYRWAQPVRTSLKKELISYLSNTLPSYAVEEYPWSNSQDTDILLTIKINEFIYQNGKITLNGYYIIKNKNGEYKKIFSFEKNSSKEPDDMVKNMRELYKELEEEIKKRTISQD